MTSQPLRAIPVHLQPNAKAAPTAQTVSLSVGANTNEGSSRASSQARPSKRRQDAVSTDFLSDTATLALIRRVLSTQSASNSDQRSTPRPIEDLLPPLTSSNEVDVQLYAIIAIIVRDFVYTWYSKITSDQVFVEEVIQIIAHCSRALEQRLRRIDVDELVLDEIPAVISAHVQAYRIAHDVEPTSEYGSTPSSVYHALNPHPALPPNIDTDDHKNEVKHSEKEIVYRQLLVQGVLAVLLPTEDLENACLRTFVGDVLADLILGQGVASKACQAWFLQDACIKLAELIHTRIEPKATGAKIEVQPRGRLDKYGLLSKEETESQTLVTKDQSRWSALFWRLVQYAYMFTLFIRFVVRGIAQARHLPPRSRQTLWDATSHESVKASESRSRPMPTTLNLPLDCRPIIEYRIFRLASLVLDLSTRMPWLAGTFTLFQQFALMGPGRLGSADSVFDRFLHSTIRTHALPPSVIPPLLLNLRAVLFPGNAGPPPGQEPPTAEERLKIRRRAAQAILSLFPPTASRVYFSAYGDEGDEEAIRQVEEILDVFGNEYMNKHLLYNILELVIVRLVPEMRDLTPSELLAERGIG